MNAKSKASNDPTHRSKSHGSQRLHILYHKSHEIVLMHKVYKKLNLINLLESLRMSRVSEREIIRPCWIQSRGSLSCSAGRVGKGPGPGQVHWYLLLFGPRLAVCYRVRSK